jgi:hypothetical protein
MTPQIIAAGFILFALIAILAWGWSVVSNGFRSCDRCGLMFSGDKCPSCSGRMRRL